MPFVKLAKRKFFLQCPFKVKFVFAKRFGNRNFRSEI